jgi:site-specific recombinase XerD
MYHIRHVAASQMLAAGADLMAVSAQLGHSSISTTGAFYAHVVNGSQQKAAAVLPSLSSAAALPSRS